MYKSVGELIFLHICPRGLNTEIRAKKSAVSAGRLQCGTFDSVHVSAVNLSFNITQKNFISKFKRVLLKHVKRENKKLHLILHRTLPLS